MLTTKELPSLLDNHVSITETVFEIKAFLSADVNSKCFLSIQLAKMLKLSTPPHKFIPAVTAGSDCISDAHYSIY